MAKGRAVTATMTVRTQVRPTGVTGTRRCCTGGMQGFLDAVVPFVRDGIERGQPVLVAVIAPRICGAAGSARIRRRPGAISWTWPSWARTRRGSSRPGGSSSSLHCRSIRIDPDAPDRHPHPRCRRTGLGGTPAQRDRGMPVPRGVAQPGRLAGHAAVAALPLRRRRARRRRHRRGAPQPSRRSSNRTATGAARPTAAPITSARCSRRDCRRPPARSEIWSSTATTAIRSRTGSAGGPRLRG